MNLKDKILAFMSSVAYCPLLPEDLAEELGLKAKELDEFWRVMAELEEAAAIIRTKNGKFGMPDKMNMLVGTLSASEKGYGFVIPDNPEEQDVYIPADFMHDAMHRDRVVVRVNQLAPAAGKARDGEITRIVQRANAKVVGTYESSRNFGFVIPDDSRIGRDIFVPKDETGGARTGYKVVVEITRWPERRRSAEGRIIEVLGNRGDPGIEILSIIKKHDLPADFAPEIEQAVATVPKEITQAEITGRRDLRELSIVTVDSEDAKDLDDAVHVKRLDNGRYILGVHIADVSYYVRENSPLDLEARRRGTSVYLVDRVLPMLPAVLSNGICSLNAGEDRLALSVQMEIDHRGNVFNYEIFPSIIKVRTRLSYNIVKKILVDNDENLKEQYKPLLGDIAEMERLCLILRDRRMRRGAIDFDFPELKVKLDEKGQPVEIIKRVRTIAESIIEEFMLIANETVAEHMHRLAVPVVFRVHEEPDSEKMAKLNNLLHNFGQALGKTEDVRPKALQKILGRIAGRPEERIISTVMLRSLKQARYEAQNLGHFGLAATYYTHFTSPIRRYPDLIVHRILRETFQSGDVSAKRRQKLAALLPEIALHSSQRERAAAEAERESVDLKKAEYMAKFIGEEYIGIISGVTSFGLFVELDNGVEGLVHVSGMDDDYYNYSEDSYALIGSRSGKVYRLGDQTRVILTKVNPEERTIDFSLASGFSLGAKTVKQTRKKPPATVGKARNGKRKPSLVKAKRKKGRNLTK